MTETWAGVSSGVKPERAKPVTYRSPVSSARAPAASAAVRSSPTTWWSPPEASVKVARLARASWSVPKPTEWSITPEPLTRSSSSS